MKEMSGAVGVGRGAGREARDAGGIILKAQLVAAGASNFRRVTFSDGECSTRSQAPSPDDKCQGAILHANLPGL